MTLLGRHTLDETRDLLAVADYRFKETGKAYDALVSHPADLEQDWKDLTSRWDKDRKAIATELKIQAVKGFPLPSNAITTEPEYKRVLDYVQFQENVKGSLQDITRRIEQLSKSPILYKEQPGSKPTTDLDLELFKDLDQTTRNLDAAADAAKSGAKDAALSNWGLLLGATVAVTLVGTHYLKKL